MDEPTQRTPVWQRAVTVALLALLAWGWILMEYIANAAAPAYTIVPWIGLASTLALAVWAMASRRMGIITGFALGGLTMVTVAAFFTEYGRLAAVTAFSGLGG